VQLALESILALVLSELTHYIYIYTHENKACTGTIQTHTAIANVTAYMHDGRFQLSCVQA
jgi:hypothetical protein